MTVIGVTTEVAMTVMSGHNTMTAMRDMTVLMTNMTVMKGPDPVHTLHVSEHIGC